MMIRIMFMFLNLIPHDKRQMMMEIIALRSQLATFQVDIAGKKRPKPRISRWFRKLWVLLSKKFDGWSNSLMLVKPETVLAWHRRGFKFYWRRKCKGGRPKISHETIALIRKIHRENPALSPEKIHERLVALNITDAPAPNTIARYIHLKRKPPTEKEKQSWKSFLHNHSKCLWAMDFATVATLGFKVLHVLFVISHDRRRIEHFAVTHNPSGAWVAQQMRNATPFGKQPKYLIHDNDSVFTCKYFQGFLARLGIVSKRIMPRCPWQNGVAERLVGIVRRELFDHVIPLNERHLSVLLKEYVEYYNNVRTHQALDGGTPVRKDKPPPTLVDDTVLLARPLLGGLYHDYDKVDVA